MISVAVKSKVCGSLIARIAGSNTTEGMGVCFFVFSCVL